MHGRARQLLRALASAGVLFAMLIILPAGARAADAMPAFGVNDLRSDGILLPNLGWNGPQDLDRLASSGVRLYRARVRMDCVRKVDGTFSFAASSRCWGLSYDDLVGALAARGQTFLPVLMNFENERPAAPTTDADRAAFADFAAAAARRFGPGGSYWVEHQNLTPQPVRSWEIWNEENNGWWWNGNASATEYAALFRTTRARLRAVDPAARTVVGGLVWDRNGESSFVEPDDMVAALAAGNANAFDAVAIHPYTDARGQTATQLGGAAAAFVDRMAATLRRTTGVTASGAPRQQIWITEMGWSDVDNTPDVIAGGMQDFAARLEAGLRAADNVGPVLWYMLRDNAVRLVRDDQLGMRLTGLTGADAGPKPIWTSFTAAAQHAPLALPDALTDSAGYTAPSGPRTADPSAPASTTSPAASTPVATTPPATTTPAPVPSTPATVPAPAPAPVKPVTCPASGKAPTKKTPAAKTRAAVICLINAARADAGQPAVAMSPVLVKLTNNRARQRSAARGYNAGRVGTRTWVTRGSAASPAAIVRTWLRDPTLRRSLLSARPQLGVSAAVTTVARSERVVWVLGVKAT